MGSTETTTEALGSGDGRSTAVVYLRVSSGAQVNKAFDPEGYSIPGQRSACHRHAEHLGAEIIGEYVESGRTGTNLNRPALQRLLADLPATKPTYVIFYDLSRVARDDFDAAWLWREIHGCGSKIESTRERVDSSPAGRFMYTILAGVNAMRSRDDGEKVKMGLQRKFMAGGAAGPARIGYLNAKQVVQGREVAVIVFDHDREHHVRTAFDLYATANYTLATLTDLLEEMGLRTRETPKRPSKPMSRSSVHRMLGDDFYIGMVTHNGQKLRGLHDPMIEETTFERVQQVLAAHKASGDRSHKHQHYLIDDIFRCPECDRRLGYGQHTGNGGHYEYFSCLSRVTRGGRCAAPYLHVHKVEEAVVKYHATLTYSPEQQDRIRQAVRDYITPRVEEAKKQAGLHKRRLQDLQTEQRKLVQLAYKGLVDEDVLAAEQARIKKERAEARKWIEAAASEVADAMEALDDVLALADEHLPYAGADPTLRHILNQATHLRIAPVLVDDPDEPHRCRIIGERDPFYIEADLLVGKAPAERSRPFAPETAQGSRETTETPISRGHGSDKTRLAERGGFEPPMD
ncbi:MAG: recombinase family protein [Actinomycetota bacterium]|nr:recombinase family protein [Actinomycetota bacterium]